MCSCPHTDRTTALVRFITERTFRDDGAKTVAIMSAFPGVSYSEVMRADAIAFDVVRARIAGDQPKHQEGEP